MHGRKEAELARYFKLEYGEAEVGRLLAQTRAARPPSPGRFWAGLRQRVATRRQNGTAVASASALLNGAAPAKDPTPQKLPVDCRHGEWETLGSGGSSTYLRCRTCGALVVSQGGRLWSFARDRPEGI
ncbi:MAG: hypothetical protein LN410_01965 [Candidatus Thermoplasmatota archaeon]|nr:hypothetical protein [Candidatus Thermoplasmatota archaeon]